MHNYIGIDISMNSTAVFIESDLGKKILSFTNKKDNNIYIKRKQTFSECAGCKTVRLHTYHL